MYTKKIEKIYNRYVKLFKRKDETFEMTTIRTIVEELENGDYDVMEYSEAEIKVICKYLSERYEKKMNDRAKYLCSDEYAKKSFSGFKYDVEW